MTQDLPSVPASKTGGSPSPSAAAEPGGDDQLPMLVVDRSDGGGAAPVRRGFRRIYLLPLLILLIPLGGILGLYFQPPGLQWAMGMLDLSPGAGTDTPIALPIEQANKDGAAGNGQGLVLPVRSVIGLGTLVPEGDVVTVALPSGAGDARIASITVSEGSRVERGDVVAVLDNEPRLSAAVDAATAAVNVREADLERTRRSVSASLGEARAALASAEAAALSAMQDLERTRQLFDRQIVTRAALDTKQSVADQTQKQVEQAKATLSRFASDDVEAQSDVVVAARNLDAARADLRTAERNLDQASVRAPLTGTVLDIHARAGEKPGTDGVMDIGNIDHMTAKVEIYQSQIGAVSVGDTVEITADALSAPLTGTVSQIGLQIRRQTVINSDPAANTDARVVEVTVTLDDTSSLVASRYTNLQVEAHIKVGPQS